MKKNLLGACLLTFTCLYGLLAAILILLFMITGTNILLAIIICIVVLIVQYLISPFLTDLSMKWFYKAKFNYQLPDYLKTFIDELCKKYNMKYPTIGFIDDGAPNAFTYGRGKNDARIVVTRGLFDLLSEEEVIAVIGHEMGHVTHYDMLFMTMAQLVPLVLYGIYEVFAKNNDGDRDNSKAAAVGYLAYLLYVISEYIVLYLSRLREYYADEFSARETKNPSGLASALVKIGYGLSSNSQKTRSSANALGIFDSSASKSLVVSAYNGKEVSKEKIKNAMKWEQWNLWAIYYEFLSTHPLISKRLLALSELCKEFNQEPYITFDLNREESYVDDFFFELLILALPTITFIVGIVLFIVTNNIALAGIMSLLCWFFSYYKFDRSHKNKGYKETNVSELLGEVKVSHVTSVPCILKGKIIGRGNPGCIFNEDFVIQDETGIIFLDYNQPLYLLNKLFAIFMSKDYFDKEVTINGWYRRGKVPYVEIYSMTIDGKTKKIYTYILTKIVYIILLLGLIAIFSLLFMNI